MRRSLLLVPLLAGSVSTASALEGIYGLKDVSVTFDAIGYGSQEFSVGYFDDDWSSGNRYELNIVTQLEGDRARPSGGMYIFYEERDWQGDVLLGTQERANLECWGFGMQGGAAIHLLPQDGRLWLALVPYLRAGLGFQDFSGKDVIIDGARYDMQADSGRLEFAAGADLRLTVARRIEVVFGGGVDYWAGADVALYAGSGGGGVAVGSNGTFSGTDAWARFGVGVHF